MNEGILYTRSYGTVRLRLKELMDQQGLNRNQMAKLIDVRFEVVDKWYQGEVERMDLDVLARICFVLKCQPGDLLEYAETEQPEQEPRS